MGSKIDWYTGGNFSLGMERAWHLTLALIYLVFKPTIQQWSYLPTILHIISILVIFYFVYKLYGKREALISALLIAILPSNVTMGGPVFLIPVNLSLIFIPLALIFAFELTKIKKLYNYILLFIVTTFLLYAHPPTALILIFILITYLILQLFSKDKQRIIYLSITITSSIIASIPNYLQVLEQKGLESIKFNFWIYLKGIPIIYGIIPSFFFIIGFYILSKNKDNKSWSLLITSIVLILNILFFTKFNINYIIPYQRTYIPLFLIMSIIASRGYTKLLEIDKPIKKTGLIILIILLLTTTYIAIDNNTKTNYYHIIDTKDYNSFLWIKENTSKDAIILSDPWKARALAPIAERRVYAVMPFGPDEKQLKLVENANKFLADNCSNTTFLLKNNITIIYTRTNCQNQDLFELKENIYILEDIFHGD